MVWFLFNVKSNNIFMLLCVYICTCSYIVTFLPHSFFMFYILEITSCPAVLFFIFIFAWKSFPYYHINLFPECDELFLFLKSIVMVLLLSITYYLTIWTLSLHFQPSCPPCSESGPVPSISQSQIYWQDQNAKKMHEWGSKNL